MPFMPNCGMGKKNLVLLCGSCESKPSFVVSQKNQVSIKITEFLC
uniref:Uncharacterized protein n=1 Tax=Enterobacter sp. HP19 TaxID=1811975 RepID=A0A2H4UEA8_9ENTR|nr:hypothetical protein [Enterobacter sp. HP19]